MCWGRPSYVWYWNHADIQVADKGAAQGTLTPAERAEYETRVRAINFVAVSQANGRAVIAAETSICSEHSA